MRTRMRKTGKTVYEEITERIIESLEAGVAPWVRPWGSARLGQHRNGVTDRPYSGINIMLLNLVAMKNGFADPRWLTFKNAEQLGGHVRKGEKGVGIVFWKIKFVGEHITDDADNEDDRNVVPLLRMFTVFNVEQCENIELPPLEVSAGITDVENPDAEQILALPDLKHGGNEAYYSKTGDFIVMPDRESFDNLNFYYSTFYHEIVHWSGHPSRLSREFGMRFGDQNYAFEELIAEIGSAFLGSATGIPFENMRHPEYVGSWLQILSKDTRAIFTAAAKAQVAADFVLDKKYKLRINIKQIYCCDLKIPNSPRD